MHYRKAVRIMHAVGVPLRMLEEERVDGNRAGCGRPSIVYLFGVC
jgi:hypothetical protein